MSGFIITRHSRLVSNPSLPTSTLPMYPCQSTTPNFRKVHLSHG